MNKQEFIKKLESLVPMKLEKLEDELFMWVESKFKEEKQSILKAIMENMPNRKTRFWFTNYAPAEKDSTVFNYALDQFESVIKEVLSEAKK